MTRSSLIASDSEGSFSPSTKSEAVPLSRPPLNVTVVVAVRNEGLNLERCLASVAPAVRVLVVDSGSTDDTVAIARRMGAEVLSFRYGGGYPKKRQWVLDTVPIETEWVLLLDADETIPNSLWSEMRGILGDPMACDAYAIKKGFHFLGRRFHFGGFSHAAVVFFRAGKARFEELFVDSAQGLDMEVHERIVVNGTTGQMRTPLVHEDFKGLEAYIDRHNRYSSWEANVRLRYLDTHGWGGVTITPRPFGNVQERRRYLKGLVVRLPFEAALWFAYHYVACLGFLEGRPGLIASRIRAQYVSNVHAKLYELRLCDRNRCTKS